MAKKKKKILKKLADSEVEVVAMFEQDGQEHPRYGYLFRACDCVACTKAGKKYYFAASTSVVVPFIRYFDVSDVREITKLDGVYRVHL